MKVSDYIATFLAATGCRCIFGYPGGAVTHLVDSIYQHEELKFIGACHEQAAAFAAEGYARAAKQNDAIGVAVATSGPGATNLITGIGSAYFDSIPCLYLTGQVNTYEYKGDAPIRQIGFQETDIVSIVKPITKYAVRVTRAEDIRQTLERAVHIVRTGRKGPVLVDIPMDIQRAEVDDSQLKGFVAMDSDQIKIELDSVLQLLNASKRPILLVGGGIQLSGATQTLQEVATALRLPVVSSLMGKDAFDNNSQLYAGMLGAYGNRYANLAVANCDLILAIGTRLDSRQVGTQPKTFARAARIIRVDIDQMELDHDIKDNELKIQADAGDFLSQVMLHKQDINPDTSDWLEQIKQYKHKYPDYASSSFDDPNFLMTRCSKLLGDEDVVCLDVGQNQMWASQSLSITGASRLLISGGMGAMGFSIPCAIGAYYSGVKGKVYAFCGDGGAQMNLQELEVIRRNNLPIKIIVFNNQSLGMIRHFQEMYFESRYCATVTDYSAPDFCKIADAYGIKSSRIEGMLDFSKVRTLLAEDGPVLIEMMLPHTTYVYPKLAVNRPIEDQEPLLSREELVENMLIEVHDPAELTTEQYGLFIRRTFDAYKCKSGVDSLRMLPILAADGSKAGFLQPITVDYRTELPGCGVKLAQWRNKYPEMAATQFEATAKSTEQWLDDLVLGRADRILFMIVPDRKTAIETKESSFEGIGHIGLSSFDFEARSCEIDAVIRGESVEPGLMGCSLRTLINWCMKQLGVQAVGLRVMETNHQAIDFYLKNGFIADKSDITSEYLSMRFDTRKNLRGEA